jgi:hypothetical protein
MEIGNREFFSGDLIFLNGRVDQPFFLIGNPEV